jgi:hypothetical protein
MQREINDLLDRQADALQSATFLGMTDEEALEYADRRTRIKELIKELFQFDRTQ